MRWEHKDENRQQIMICKEAVMAYFKVVPNKRLKP